MLDKPGAYEKALLSVQKNTKHPDYERVVKLTKEFYRPFITGEDADHLFRQFNMRESDAAFAQAKRITQLVTPAICNTIITPSRKVPGVKPVLDTYGYTPPSVEKVRELRLNLEAFYGDKSLDYYLGVHLPDESAIDPNQFLLLYLQDEDIAPALISSTDAWHYEYKNGILQFLTIHREIEYAIKDDKTRKGDYFVTYGRDDHIEFTQIDVEPFKQRSLKKNLLYDATFALIQDVENTRPGADYFMLVNDSKMFQVRFFEHKTGRVPALRIGFRRDPVTKGRTCVSLIHPAVQYLMKSVKTGRELDLSQALHTFMQKLSYYPPCPGKDDVTCNKGQTPDGKTCGNCKGLGYLVHESSQDNVGMMLPDDPAQIIDLSKLVHYVNLPVDLLTHLVEYINILEQKALKAVYTSDTFTRDSTVATATEKVIELDSVNDALQPFAEHYAWCKTQCIIITAGYLSIDAGLTVAIKLPRKLLSESLEKMVSILKQLRDGGASEPVINQVINEISDHLYRDNPTALDKVKTQELFNPFKGKSEPVIAGIMAQNLCTLHDKVLWSLSASIFSELELQMEEQGRDFYALTYIKQKELVDKAVADRIAKIEAENPPITSGFDVADDEEEEAP